MNSYESNNRNIPRFWSQLSYSGENRIPAAQDPKAGSWPTYFFKKDEYGSFTDLEGNSISFKVRQPDITIDFEGEELDIVKNTFENLTPHQKRIAEYWGTGPATKQWTPIIDILIDTYNITASRAARILAASQAAFNDAFIITWYFKYLWDIARPNQLDQNLTTFLSTPKHPSYPSGHSVTAGCIQVVLSYFFESEANHLKELSEECASSRLYAGVHFPIDNNEGLRLGRHIGELIVAQLDKQRDIHLVHIDYPITENRHAKLPPPPYKQVISPYNMQCNSKCQCEKLRGDMKSNLDTDLCKNEEKTEE